MKINFALAALFISICIPFAAYADDTVSVYLQVESGTGTVFPKQLVNVGACSNRENSATTTVNALCAFDAAGLATGLTWFDFGSQVDSVNGVVAPGYPGDTWIFFFNDDISNFGASDTLLSTSDSILWTLSIQPMHISVSDTSPTVGGTTTVTVTGFDTGTFAFVPVADATVVGVEGATDVNGQLDIAATSTDALTIYATQTGYLQSATTTIAAVAAETPAPVVNSGGGGGEVVHIKLNVPNALAYLVSKQSADGSFGSALYSDWAALAFAAGDSGTGKTSLRNYLLSSSPALSSATDYERHAMALMALDINPYTETSKDSITPIINAFDGTQIGDASFENDDIFALFPLTHAGYSAGDDIIQKTVAFIISRQLESGAWTGGVDMTAAAVQALAPLSALPGVPAALTKAEGYLRTQQQTNGGFGGSFSTSWVLQAISALGQSSLSWTANGLTPGDYLASLQQADGGIEPATSDESTRIWASSYAIPASLGKTWNSLLSSYSKPTGAVSNSGAATATTSAATSTISVATSTPIVATSTPEIIATSTPESIATSTPALEAAASTSTATATPEVKKPKVKTPAAKKIQVPLPASTTPTSTATNQTAAAANLSGGFLSGWWRSISSFFSWLF